MYHVPGTYRSLTAGHLAKCKMLSFLIQELNYPFIFKLSNAPVQHLLFPGEGVFDFALKGFASLRLIFLVFENQFIF